MGGGACFTETYSVPLAKLILKIRGLLVFYCSGKGQHETLGENEFDYPFEGRWPIASAGLKLYVAKGDLELTAFFYSSEIQSLSQSS